MAGLLLRRSGLRLLGLLSWCSLGGGGGLSGGRLSGGLGRSGLGWLRWSFDCEVVGDGLKGKIFVKSDTAP